MNTAIPIVPVSERRRILSTEVNTETHAMLYRRMPFRDLVEYSEPQCSSARPHDELPPPRTRTEEGLRVLAWNAARCPDVDAVARRIVETRAEVVLLTEMDWGMARSGQRHTSRGLAEALSCGYLFAVEFLELGLGDENEKERFHGTENEVGYHGAAILSPYPALRRERIMLEESGGWFGESRGQRRVGGRIALAALLDVAARYVDTTPHEPPLPVLFVSVHLESESDPIERAREMDLLFDRVDEGYPGTPIVIGGDFNTFSLPRRELDHEETIRRRLEEAPSRFVDPTPFEPLFQRSEDRGYEWRLCNDLRVPTHHSPGEAPESLSMKIDWFLCRGLTGRNPRVISSVADETPPISDHDAISLSLFDR